MSNPPPTVLQMARQGNPDAIATLMNRHLGSQGITARVAQQDSTLQVSLESAHVPNQADLVAYVRKGIVGLELDAIYHLTVSAKQPGSDASAWSEDLVLRDSPLKVGAGADAELALGFETDSGDSAGLGDLGDFDALLAAAPNDVEGDPDLELGFTDSDLGSEDSADFDTAFTSASAAADADFDLDFGLTDAPAEDTADELDFDLDAASSADDFDLDLALGNSPADSAAADLELDFAEASAAAAQTDLGFDLGGFDEAGDEAAAADLDFDLGEAPEASTSMGDADFDLGMDEPAEATPASDLDFDLGMDEPAEATSANDLDFDLGMDEPAEATPASDLDFDLDMAEPAEATPASDLDFDLGMDESAAPVEGLDFDLSLDEDAGVASPGDDLGLEADGGAAASVSDFDFDLGMDDGSAAADFELDLGDAPAGEFATDGFDLGLDDTPGQETPAADLDFGLDLSDHPPVASAGEDFDLNFAEADVDLEGGTPDPETFDDGTELAALDLDFDDNFDDAGLALAEDGAIAELEDLDDPAAIAEANAFELPNDPGIPPTAPDISDGLDDLWDDPSSINPADSAPWAAEAIAPDDAFADLDISPVTVDYDADLESLPPDLLAQEDVVSEDLSFDDLGAAADLDLAEPPAFAPEGWVAEPDLSPAAEIDLGNYDDIGADDLADVGSVAEATPQPWAAAEEGFDPDLELDADFDPNLADGSGLDPSLAFDPQIEADYTTPNPFEAEAFPLDDDGSGVEMSFSTMELDRTVEGDLMPSTDLAFDSGLGELEDYGDVTLEQPDLYGATDPDFAAVGFGDEVDEDLAFESVEFGADDGDISGFEDGGLVSGGFEPQSFDDPGFGDPGFDDAVVVKDLGAPDLGDPNFDQTSFGDDGFDSDGFGDSPEDANGFLSNGAALGDAEPDDFIQEFGSDPSSHVSLAPDQFNEDGSVRRSGGSGLPMKLIVGLGLGALALALIALLLNGVVRRLRQPSPGGAPVVTEPATPADAPPDPAEPPVDPAAVEEADLFRQAVNAAQTAANQAQTANSAAEWQAVADAWASSIALMERVPESDPNYALAQQKAVEYQPNLAYAQQNVQRF